MSDDTRGMGPISISGASNGMTASNFAPAEATRAVLADHERKHNDLSNYTQRQVLALTNKLDDTLDLVRWLYVWCGILTVGVGALITTEIVR